MTPGGFNCHCLKYVDDFAKIKSIYINLVPVSYVSSEASFCSYYSTLFNSLHINFSENSIPYIPKHIQEVIITALQQEISAQILVQEAESVPEYFRKQAKVYNEAMHFLLK